MDDLVAFSGFLSLPQSSKELICQNVSFFRVYGIEIGSAGAGFQEVIENILRSSAWKNDLIFYEIRKENGCSKRIYPQIAPPSPEQDSLECCHLRMHPREWGLPGNLRKEVLPFHDPSVFILKSAPLIEKLV